MQEFLIGKFSYQWQQWCQYCVQLLAPLPRAKKKIFTLAETN